MEITLSEYARRIQTELSKCDSSNALLEFNEVSKKIEQEINKGTVKIPCTPDPHVLSAIGILTNLQRQKTTYPPMPTLIPRSKLPVIREVKKVIRHGWGEVRIVVQCGKIETICTTLTHKLDKT